MPFSAQKKQGKASWIHTKKRTFVGSETASTGFELALRQSLSPQENGKVAAINITNRSQKHDRA